MQSETRVEIPMVTRRSWLVLGVLVVVAIANCGGSDGGNAGADDTATPADAAGDVAVVPDTGTPDTPADDLAVEAETHATPAAPQLTDAHQGWKNPKCLTCHTYDQHNDGDDPYLCAGCHGNNGAPNRHNDVAKCSTCHGTPHGTEGFPDPLACKACHLQ